MNKRDLKRTIKNAYNHLNKNGVFLVETAFIKDKFNVKENRKTYQDDNLKIIREIGIKYGKDSVILNAKYKINSSEFIENDEQKILLFKENDLQNLFLSANFKVKTYHYRHNKSTLFLGLK